MSLEHLTVPHAQIEICPENSRFSMRWNTQAKEFTIHKKGEKNPILTLSYNDGRYIYASLRGQQRIEEMGRAAPTERGALSKDRWMQDMSRSGLGIDDTQLQVLWEQLMATIPFPLSQEARNPAVTHRHLYLGNEPYIYTEPHNPGSIFDSLPREKSIGEDCHVAAQKFIISTGRNIGSAATILQTIPAYKDLEKRVSGITPPFLIELASKDNRVNKIRKLRKGTLLQAHSAVVLGKDKDDYIIFEKVGNNLPWRLSTLRETYSMYESDFKSANAGVPKLFWTVSTLEPAGVHFPPSDV